MDTENLELCRLLSLGMSCFLQNPHLGHYLVRQLPVYWPKKGWVDFLYRNLFGQTYGLNAVFCELLLCKGQGCKESLLSFFFFFPSPTPSQNKTFFHQFSLKENWLQHRGTMNETEESKYDWKSGGKTPKLQNCFSRAAHNVNFF